MAMIQNDWARHIIKNFFRVKNQMHFYENTGVHESCCLQADVQQHDSYYFL